MTFNDNARLDTSQVRGGRSGGGMGRGAMIGGGGLGSLLLLVLFMFFGGNIGGGGGGGGQLPQNPPPGQALNPFDTKQVEMGGDLNADLGNRCKTGADANRYDDCRVIGTVNSVQAYWEKKLPEATNGQLKYTDTLTTLYQGSTPSACGTASNQVGPFYCPRDKGIYIDASFFSILSKNFGADGGPLAQMYVVAHEYGHALQDQLGLLERAQRDPQGASSGAVRVELMADCLAGMWAKDAATTQDDAGNTLIKPLTQADIESALSAAEAVGDDHIQKKSGMRVNPDGFTHGTSQQRMQWFMIGYRYGDLNRCNTFNTRAL